MGGTSLCTGARLDFRCNKFWLPDNSICESHCGLYEIRLVGLCRYTERAGSLSNAIGLPGIGIVLR